MNCIELLESRIAPAGIVEVLVKNGALSLKTLATGDGDENLAITSTGPGLFTIDPDAATTLRVNGTDLAAGDATTVMGITKGVTVALGKGNDTLDLSGDVAGKLTVDLGDGNDTMIVRPGNYTGDVTIKGGAGNDSVSSAPNTGAFFFGGKLTATLGEGNNTFNFTTTTTVGGNLSVTSGAGNDTLQINGPHSFTVGGNFTFASGKGEDTLAVNIGDTLAVGKNLTFSSLGGAGDVSQVITSQRGPTVGGKVAFTASSGGQLTQSITASALGIKIAGAVSFTGTAKDSLNQTISANAAELVIGGKTSFKGTCLSVTQLVDGNTIALGGAVSLTASAPKTLPVIIPSEGGPERAFIENAQQTISTDPLVDSSGSSIKGPVTIAGGETVAIKVVGEIRGAVTILPRPTFADPVVTLGLDNATHTTRFLGPVKVTSAATSTDTLNLFGSTFAGTVNFTGGKGSTKLDVRDSVFLKAVTFSGGAGADTVAWETTSIAGRDGLALSTVKLNGGAGADTFNFGGNAASDAVLFLGLITIDGGADTDAVNIGTMARLLVAVKQSNVP